MLSKAYICANVNIMTVNVRNEPSLSSKILRTVDAIGEVVTIDEKIGDWQKYNFADSSTGWINTLYHNVSILPDNNIDLPIIYVTQNDAGSDTHINDCGIACAAMFLRPKIIDSVEKLANSVGMQPKSLTKISDIITLFTRYKKQHRFIRPLLIPEIINHLKDGFGTIALVNYKYISPPKSFPHFISIYGYNVKDETFKVYDPYNIRVVSIPLKQLAKAMLGVTEQNNMAWQGIIVKTGD